MSWVVTAVSVTATVVSAATTIYTSNKAADAQESAAAAQSREAMLRAKQEQEVAAENARRREMQATKDLAKQRAALAASGLAIEGTPLAVLGETYTDAKRDIGDIVYGSKMRSRAATAQAYLAQSQGKSAASATRLQGYGQAASTVAGGTKSFL